MLSLIARTLARRISSAPSRVDSMFQIESGIGPSSSSSSMTHRITKLCSNQSLERTAAAFSVFGCSDWVLIFWDCSAAVAQFGCSAPAGCAGSISPRRVRWSGQMSRRRRCHLCIVPATTLSIHLSLPNNHHPQSWFGRHKMGTGAPNQALEHNRHSRLCVPTYFPLRVSVSSVVAFILSAVPVAQLVCSAYQWSSRRDSNPQPDPYKETALPLSYATLQIGADVQAAAR